MAKLRCDESEGLWHMMLKAGAPVAWPQGLTVRTWPVTVPAARARDAAPLAADGRRELGTFSVQSVTSLVAFAVEVTGGAAEDRIRFVLNLPGDGLPEDFRALWETFQEALGVEVRRGP